MRQQIICRQVSWFWPRFLAPFKFQSTSTWSSTRSILRPKKTADRPPCEVTITSKQRQSLRSDLCWNSKICQRSQADYIIKPIFFVLGPLFSSPIHRGRWCFHTQCCPPSPVRSGGSTISGALGKTSRLCPHDSKFTYLINKLPLNDSQCIWVVAKHDSILEEHIEKHNKGTVSYLFHNIQDELIQLMGNHEKNKISYYMWLIASITQWS